MSDELSNERKREAADCARCLVEHVCPDVSEKSTEELVRMLDECFNGAGEWGAFLDEKADGMFPMLEALNGEEASRPTAGISIANHVHHVIFSIDTFMKRLSGDEKAFETDWNESWRERPLSDAGWRAMREDLLARWEKVRPIVRDHASEDFWMMLGLLAHTVFHLGAIRVKFDEIKAKN